MSTEVTVTATMMGDIEIAFDEGECLRVYGLPLKDAENLALLILQEARLLRHMEDSDD